MADEPYKDAETLRKLYWNDGKTTTEIADKFGENTGTIVYWMDKHGIEREAKGKRRRSGDSRLYDKESLKKLYKAEKKSIYEIADELDVTPTTVSEWLAKHGIEARDSSDAQTRGEFPYKNADKLRSLYHDEGMTLAEIGNKYGVEQSTVVRWFDNEGIERRTSSESRELRGTHHRPIKKGPHTDQSWLREKYHDEKMTLREMADEAGLASEVTIMEWMDRFGIERRSKSAAFVLRDIGAGFVQADARGYEQIKHSVDDTTKQFSHHRLLAIAKYGYDEVKDKHVHHKNGVKWDNRLENIELVDGNSEHAKYHKDEWGGQGRPDAPRDEDTGRSIG